MQSDHGEAFPRGQFSFPAWCFVDRMTSTSF